MIISVHLPKTAGTSFSSALEQHFGPKLLKDYADGPMHIPPFDRNRGAMQAGLLNAENPFPGIECIHGHFLPMKFLLAAGNRDIRFITWMRHPVERVLSHYFYWRKSYDPKTSLPFQRKIVEENWPIERFVLGPEMRDLYCQYFWGFPLAYFEFIGITEFYDADFAYFAEHFLQTIIEPQKLNVGDREGKAYEIDSSLRKQIEAFHARDMGLYQRAMEHRAGRFSG